MLCRALVKSLVITVVVDDRVCYGCSTLAVHGLSIHVNADGHHLLLDVGPRFDVLRLNAEKLGLDLKRVKAVVLSHGHYDHVDALPQLLELADPVVVAHPRALKQQYIVSSEGLRYVGPSRHVLDAVKRARILLSREPVEIAPRIWFLGEIPRRYPWSAPWRSYVVEEGEAKVHMFEDDSGIAVHVEGYGVVVIAGCSHSGVHNIVHRAAQVVGERVRMFVGGPHLIGYDPRLYEDVARTLRDLGLETVVACHCIEFEALKRLSEVLDVRYGCCGAVIEIGGDGRVEFRCAC